LVSGGSGNWSSSNLNWSGNLDLSELWGWSKSELDLLGLGLSNDSDWCWGWDNSLDNWSWGRGGSSWGVLDDGVESVDGIGGVLNSSQVTVGLNEGVRSLDDSVVSAFGSRLVVSGLGVSYAVGVVVLGVGVNGFLNLGGNLGNWDWSLDKDWSLDWESEGSSDGLDDLADDWAGSWGSDKALSGESVGSESSIDNEDLSLSETVSVVVAVVQAWVVSLVDTLVSSGVDALVASGVDTLVSSGVVELSRAHGHDGEKNCYLHDEVLLRSSTGAVRKETC
jgi:hypothetical protein